MSHSSVSKLENAEHTYLFGWVLNNDRFYDAIRIATMRGVPRFSGAEADQEHNHLLV